jgi:hypothetical protein
MVVRAIADGGLQPEGTHPGAEQQVRIALVVKYGLEGCTGSTRRTAQGHQVRGPRRPPRRDLIEALAVLSSRLDQRVRFVVVRLSELLTHHVGVC